MACATDGHDLEDLPFPFPNPLTGGPMTFGEFADMYARMEAIKQLERRQDSDGHVWTDWKPQGDATERSTCWRCFWTRARRLWDPDRVKWAKPGQWDRKFEWLKDRGPTRCKRHRESDCPI